MKRVLAVAVAVVTVSPGTAVPLAAAVGTSTESSAAASRTISIRLRAAVKRLPVAREVARGYDRDKFGDWIDADHDCRDTRDEVLATESRRRVGRDCDVTHGLWHSYYDDRFWRDSGDVDIDHMVPLSEAWKSGARRWTAGTRHRYANDLRDRRTLVAVTDNVNQSKGDSDPAHWLPTHRRCLYIGQYTAVKLRWSLKVDRQEKRTLRRIASRCDNNRLRVHRARVVTRR